MSRNPKPPHRAISKSKPQTSILKNHGIIFSNGTRIKIPYSSFALLINAWCHISIASLCFALLFISFCFLFSLLFDLLWLWIVPEGTFHYFFHCMMFLICTDSDVGFLPIMNSHWSEKYVNGFMVYAVTVLSLDSE